MLLGATTPVVAQSEIYRFFGTNGRQDFLGVSVAMPGDMNRDGFADFVAGADAARNPASPNTSRGAVLAFSGRDGRLLYSWYGPTIYDRLGAVVAAAGDVNGDGYPDVVAGSPTNQTKGTRVRARSG